MLGVLTVVIMLGVGYAYLVEGLFTAFLMCLNVLGAGLVAFNFWEPLADLLEPMLQDSLFAGYEDAFALFSLFCLTLGILRTITNNLASAEIEFDEPVQRFGGAFFGLATGYLAAGFLICLMQTLPWHERFMGFDPRYNTSESFVRQFLPPDRVWLASMHRAGAVPFTNGDPTFDQNGTFELRYARYRRYNDDRNPLNYAGEFEEQLRASPPPAPMAPPPAPGN